MHSDKRHDCRDCRTAAKSNLFEILCLFLCYISVGLSRLIANVSCVSVCTFKQLLQSLSIGWIPHRSSPQTRLKMNAICSLGSSHVLSSALPGIARLPPLCPFGNAAHSSHPFSPALEKNS